MTDKPKHKPRFMRQISKEDITRIDERTFYVPSAAINENGQKEPYFVYNSSNIGWCCDCMNYVMNIQGENQNNHYECKHIKLVISSFFTP